MSASPGEGRKQGLDWEEWGKTLTHFAAASGLVVSAYDGYGRKQLGPYCTTRLALLLASSELWDEAGAGGALERDLIARCQKSGKVESARFCNELQVEAVPLTLFGEVVGFIVFGWHFSTYTTARACENIARTLKMSGLKLWMEARLQTPVSTQRMAVNRELLQTLINAITRQSEALSHLNQLAQAREVFLATVSHEMRTPLAAILMRLELMLMGALDKPAEIRQHLTAMVGNVRQEARLVEDLIDAAQTLTGHLKIKPSFVSLASILSNALLTVEPKAEAKHVNIEMHGIEGDVALWGDRHRLEQVFWNLLFNAVKFTPAGGRVSILTRMAGSSVQVIVSDTGQGIAAKELAHVFNAFNKQSHNNEQGLGLGLFIVRQIIDLHGGTIAASSPGMDQGTTFTITLPVHAPDWEQAAQQLAPSKKDDVTQSSPHCD